MNVLTGIKLLHNQSNSNHPQKVSRTTKEKILCPEEGDILSQTQARSGLNEVNRIKSKEIKTLLFCLKRKSIHQQLASPESWDSFTAFHPLQSVFASPLCDSSFIYKSRKIIFSTILDPVNLYSGPLNYISESYFVDCWLTPTTGAKL